MSPSAEPNENHGLLFRELGVRDLEVYGSGFTETSPQPPTSALATAAPTAHSVATLHFLVRQATSCRLWRCAAGHELFRGVGPEPSHLALNDNSSWDSRAHRKLRVTRRCFHKGSPDEGVLYLFLHDEKPRCP